MFISISGVLKQKSHNTSIDYSQLDCKEREIAQEIISELKQVYLATAKKITFTQEPPCDSCLGMNKNGNIFVLWRDNINSTKETLAHELIHNLIKQGYYNGWTDGEFVLDITDTGVCYEKRK